MWPILISLCAATLVSGMIALCYYLTLSDKSVFQSHVFLPSDLDETHYMFTQKIDCPLERVAWTQWHSHRPHVSVKSPHASIPYHVHQSFCTDTLPYELVRRSQTIVEREPGLSYTFWTDTAAREYLGTLSDTRILQMYDALIPGAYKADVFRYALLYQQGGVWIDMGVEMHQTIQWCLEKEPSRDLVVIREAAASDGYWNGFIMVRPHHPALLAVLDRCLLNTAMKCYGVSSLSITGPLAWYRSSHIFEPRCWQLNKPENHRYTDIAEILHPDGGVVVATKRYFCYNQHQRYIYAKEGKTMYPYWWLWSNEQVFEDTTVV